MTSKLVLCCPSPPVDTSRCCLSPLGCWSSSRLTRLSFNCSAGAESRAPYTSACVNSNKVKISGSFLVAACVVIQNSSSEAFAAVENTTTQCFGFAGENTPVFIVVACIVQAVALVGAAVGGTLARQRKQEVEKINAQLRQIFAKMRRQYQVENYAPALTYAPVTIAKSLPETAVDSDKEQLMKHLKAGKKFLREKNPEEAFDEFEKALKLAKQLDDKVEQKKAARGLGASCQRQGKFRDAIKYHSMVLTISHISGEHSGVTEALGAIADCYAELDDLENAAKYYDQYIARIDEE